MRFLFSPVFFIPVFILSFTTCAQPKNNSYGYGIYPFALGENYIEIKSPGTPTKRVVFTKAYGDWYIKPDDASATVNLEGITEGKEVTLQASWDGVEKQQLIENVPKFHDNRDEYRLFYYFENPSSALYSFGQGNAINVSITKWDAGTLSFSFEGHKSTQFREYEITITGKITLHKNPLDKIITGKFRNCDPTVYNKIPGALNRSASDCEIKFAEYLNEYFFNAVKKPLLKYLLSLGYKEIQYGRSYDLRSVPPHFEDQFYNNLDLSQGTKDAIFNLENPEYPDFNNIITNEDEGKDRRMQISDSLVAIEKNKGVEEPDMSEIMPKVEKILSAEIAKSPRRIEVRCAVNDNKTDGHTGKIITPPNGATFAMQSRTRTVVGIGHWQQSATKLADKSTTQATFKAKFNPAASHISVQNILIRIDAIPDLANKILPLIDWKALNEMAEK